MANASSAYILNDEIDRLTSLCTHIHQMASNIRLVRLSNIDYSIENIQSCYHTLLSIAENVEGSAILLETLLASEQRRRIRYTRNELLRLRDRVTVTLSNEIGFLLTEVVERECNDSVELERQSWRDIKTILM